MVFSLMLMMTLYFISLTHPFTMGLVLMIMAGLFSFKMMTFNTSGWLSYMLVMIFLSGMMIIILYMTSVSSNEKMLMKSYWAVIIICGGLLSTFLMTKINLLSMKATVVTPFSSHLSFDVVFKTYSNLMMYLTILVIMYLFAVMIVAVKVTSPTKSALKLNK